MNFVKVIIQKDNRDDAKGKQVISQDNPPGTVHALEMGGGERFELPGVRGRMERLELASGLVLYRVDYRAGEDCTLQLDRPTFQQPWIGSIFHIQGRSGMELPDGSHHQVTPERALLVRTDISGTCFRLSRGEQVRHIGVACTLDVLRDHLGGGLPTALKPFVGRYGDTVAVRALHPSSRLRQLATSLFTTHAQGLCRGMKMEGAALLFLSEILENYCDSPATEALPAWEEQAFLEIRDAIVDDPGHRYPSPPWRTAPASPKAASISCSSTGKNAPARSSYAANAWTRPSGCWKPATPRSRWWRREWATAMSAISPAPTAPASANRRHAPCAGR